MCFQGYDSTALGAALDALCNDNAAAFDQMLQKQRWIQSEEVYADHSAARKERESKGWAQEALALPCIVPESLKSRDLVGDIGDTLFTVAQKNAKVAICAKLGAGEKVHAVIQRKPHLRVCAVRTCMQIHTCCSWCGSDHHGLA